MNRASLEMLEAERRETVDGRLTPSLERRRLRAYCLMMLIDAALLVLCFALAAWMWERQWGEPRAMLTAQALLPMYFTIALYNGTYGVQALSSWLYASRKALIALVVSAALFNFVAFYAKSNDEFSRVGVTLGLVFTAIALTAVRRLMAMFIAQRWGGRVANRLVIDDGGPGFAFRGADRIAAADFGLDASSHDPFMLDRLGKLLRNQDQVVVTCPPERRADWAFVLKAAGVYGEIVSERARAGRGRAAPLRRSRSHHACRVDGAAGPARARAQADLRSRGGGHRAAPARPGADPCRGAYQARGWRAGAVRAAPAGPREPVLRHAQVPLDAA
jgi:hypothetical protein